MSKSIVDDILKVAEIIDEDSCKEFFEIVEEIRKESDKLEHVEGVLETKGKQLGLNDEEFNSFTFYLLGKLHGGNNG